MVSILQECSGVPNGVILLFSKEMHFHLLLNGDY